MDQFCRLVKQMDQNDTISRPDSALFTALAIVLATASAAIGSAMTHRANIPPTDHIAKVQSATVLHSDQDVVLTDLLAEHRCLTEALYYEARGEGRTGQQAVAEVVFHRMNAGNYGHSICAVVYEGSGRPGCQFSFTCNGDLKRPREVSAWRQCEQLAAQILTGEVWLVNETVGATNYHARQVYPVWAPTLTKTARIGNHIFYRGHGATAGSVAGPLVPGPPSGGSPGG